MITLTNYCNSMNGSNQKDNNFLLIGGSPKCGTSFLFNILKNHPQVNPCALKESYYFIDKENTGINKDNNFHENGYEGFYNLFTPEKGTCYLEATSHLMYQKNMFEVVRKIGDVKMVIVLRNPVKRMISTFDYTKNNLGNIKDNPDYTFKNYIEILLSGQRERLEGWLRDPNGDYVFQRELDYSCYYEYVKKWVSALGEENVKVIQFEDLLQRKDFYLKEILDWVNLDAKFELEEDEKSKNKSFGIKNTWIQHKSIRLAQYFPNSGLKNWAKKIYFALQKQEINREHQDYLITPELVDYFNKSNENLQKEFGFRLDLWENKF